MKKVLTFLLLISAIYFAVSKLTDVYIQNPKTWMLPFTIFGFIFGFGNENYIWIGNLISSIIYGLLFWLILRGSIRYFRDKSK